MYRIFIIRTADNNLTGAAQYRVIYCKSLNLMPSRCFIVDFHRCGNKIPAFLFIASKKPYRKGCFVNPAKVLRDSGFIF